MEINEKILNNKIAIWLGWMFDSAGQEYFKEDKDGYWNYADFLHDRNQQKWIEDEIIKRGYGISFEYNHLTTFNVRWIWKVVLFKNDIKFWKQIEISNESKDQAFIEAVLELIDKESSTNCVQLNKEEK